MFLPLLRIQRENKGNQPELRSVEGGCVAVKWTMHTNYPEASQRLFLSSCGKKVSFGRLKIARPLQGRLS